MMCEATRTPRTRGFGLLSILVALTFHVFASPLGAAVIPVNDTADDLDQGPNGNCTLREAIQAANTNLPVDACFPGDPAPMVDLIAVPTGTYLLTIPGAEEDGNLTGDLDVLEDAEIHGSGPGATIIDGGGLDRVLHLGGDFNTIRTLSHLTIRGGAAPGGNDGGGILVVRGTATITHCEIVDNMAQSLWGGGIATRSGATGTIEFSTISGNSITSGFGGGVSIVGSQFVIESSTVSNNDASSQGGGIHAVDGSADVINTTVSGNSAMGSAGVFSDEFSSIRLIHTTLSENTAVVAVSALGANPYGGNITVTNSIIEGDCGGEITSGGGNLESPGDTCSFDDATDQTEVADLGLGPLGDYGGPTRVYPLLFGSPAIDTAPAGPCPPADQRSIPRPFDGDGDGTAACDAGAFEFSSLLFL
ncbi:MAG: choice-of-anchor Q domain-containing protein, partial [Acidobacteriota bacterium]